MATSDSVVGSRAPAPASASAAIGKGRVRAKADDGTAETSRAKRATSAVEARPGDDQPPPALVAKKRARFQDQARRRPEHEVDEVDELDNDGRRRVVSHAPDEAIDRDELDVSLVNQKVSKPTRKPTKSASVEPRTDLTRSVGPGTKETGKAARGEQVSPLSSSYDDDDDGRHDRGCESSEAGRDDRVHRTTDRPARMHSSRRAPSELPSQRSKSAAKRKRVGDASEMSDAITDPFLRRKLGDISRRYENLEMKHRNLREVGIKEAQANFDRLKKQAQEKGEGEFYINQI